MWEKVMEIIKLSPKYLFGVSVVSGMLLFANVKFINILGMGDFLQDYKKYLGIIFLISLIFTINELVINGVKNVKKKYETYTTKKWREKRLKKLTADEKAILNRYISNQTRTCTFSIDNGMVKEFVIYQILFRSSNIGSMYGFPYNIQPWAWDYLNKHKELLLTPVDEVNF